jgi:hypothetical protein
MLRRFKPLALSFVTLAFVAATAFAAGEAKLARTEIARQGKAATAFVEIPRGSGTAFCVHSSGLFITNEHVVRGAKAGEITLVLNPSTSDQQVLKATAVRVDKEADLALLRVDGAENLPSLKLGSIDGIAELADVVACGFPLGRRLSPDTKEYPAISVNGGTVTALRYKAGTLQFLQIDVALTFGNSGGPVLNENGEVIGVVVAGVREAKGINLAIPVSDLNRFLLSPDLVVIAPELPRETLKQPHVFKARVTSFLPNSPEPDLQLILQIGDAQPRPFPMEKQDGLWVATAPAAEPGSHPRLDVNVRLPAGSVTGTTEDRVIKVNGTARRLSGIRRWDVAPKPGILLTEGSMVVEAAVTGLDTLEIDLGGQKIVVDMKRALQMTLQPAAEPWSVTATVVATVDGKEVARTDVRIPIRDPVDATRPGPVAIPITPPELADDRIVKRLPESFSDVVVGGGGRYLVFQIPKLKKLAIFDMSEARVTKYIPLAEDNIAYAAGLDSVVIGLRETRKLERWKLSTGELEKSAAPPFNEDIGAIVMGHGSNGPMVVNGYFLDLATFHKLPILDAKGNERPLGNDRRTASGDGTVFGAWNTNQSPSTSTTFVVEGNIVKRYEAGDLHHIVPGPDGRTVYTAKGLCAATLMRSHPDDGSYGYCLPAVHGDYFLSLTSATGGKGGGFRVYLKGLTQPIASLDQLGHGLSFDGWDREPFGPWRRVFLVPDARLIAVLPPSNDQVVLYKFDAEKALEASGQDYLLVTSQPPRHIKPGETLTYPVKVKARQKVTYKIDAGPSQMQVSSEGVLTWDVPKESTGDHDVILTVTDASGQEVFHTFTIQVKA